jgi:hypothetical protein
MAKKTVDPLKAKQKKQKIVAAVLGVAFLGVMAFEVPRVMKMMKTPAPPVSHTSTTATTAAGTPALAAPTLRGAQEPGATPTGPAGSLAAAPATTVQDGQLASFSRFQSKDPFSQQLSDTPGSSSSAGSVGGSSSGGAAAPSVPTSPSSAPAPGSAVISVNGTLYTVATKSDFPQPTSTDSSIVPVFHLVSVTAHTAKIAIAGGSYATGAQTVTLQENKPVTLMNTADGTRYTLILKPLGTSVPGSGAASGGTGAGTGTGTGTGTSTTPATVTLPAATP